MNNLIGQEEKRVEPFDAAEYVVEQGYFLARVSDFEQKYRVTFPGGWGQFFAEYSMGRTPRGVLDYDEWAFLCEHFMKELTQPPGGCVDIQEEPEISLGLFFWGRLCLIQMSISEALRECLLAAAPGWRLIHQA